MNEQTVKNMIETYFEFERLIEGVTNKIGKYYHDVMPPCISECFSVTFPNENVYLEWTTEEGAMGCYDTVYNEIVFPTRYLWMNIDDVINELEEEKKCREEEEATKKAKLQAEEETKRAHKEYERYLTLKKKFEGEINEKN